MLDSAGGGKSYLVLMMVNHQDLRDGTLRLQTECYGRLLLASVHRPLGLITWNLLHLPGSGKQSTLALGIVIETDRKEKEDLVLMSF